MRDNNSSNVVIRLAEFTDATAIADLLVDSFAEYKDLYTKKAYAQTILGVYKIKERIFNKSTWVVLVDNIMSGTISLIQADNTLYIKSVAVAPAARRKGLAKAMLRHAERQAIKRRLKYLELTTTHFLIEAVKLYESFGFQQSGHKDLYGTPLIRMIKLLQPAGGSVNKRMNTYNNHSLSHGQ